MPQAKGSTDTSDAVGDPDSKKSAKDERDPDVPVVTEDRQERNNEGDLVTEGNETCDEMDHSKDMVQMDETDHGSSQDMRESQDMQLDQVVSPVGNESEGGTHSPRQLEEEVIAVILVVTYT